MGQFARDTEVSVEKSKAEIEATVMRYKGTAFGSYWDGDRALVVFEMHQRRLRFVLPLPRRDADEFRRTPARRNLRTPEEQYKAWEQACRQRWRALLLTIKAKLEAVECRITTFESEFLANFVLPSGLTIGETIIPQIGVIIDTGKLPPMLPGPVQ